MHSFISIYWGQKKIVYSAVSYQCCTLNVAVGEGFVHFVEVLSETLVSREELSLVTHLWTLEKSLLVQAVFLELVHVSCHQLVIVFLLSSMC